MNRIHFRSQSVHWPTPETVFKALDAEFNFDFDPCPIGCEIDGAGEESWVGRRAFVNPPYGPAIARFLKHAQEPDVAVFLLPARTDVRWFHELCLPIASEIRFIKGRLKFGGVKKDAPFPSMLVIFRR